MQPTSTPLKIWMQRTLKIGLFLWIAHPTKLEIHNMNLQNPLIFYKQFLQKKSIYSFLWEFSLNKNVVA